MQVLDDEINQIELFSLVSSPKQCFYCKVESSMVIAQCQICSKWFCSVNTPERSHLSWHLTSRVHKQWGLHPENPTRFRVFKCGKCYDDDLSNLCIYNSTRILCRKCCIKENTGNRSCRIDEIFTNGQVSKLVLPDPSEEVKKQVLEVNKKDALRIENRIKAGIDPYNDESNQWVRKPRLRKAQLKYYSRIRYQRIFKDILVEDMEYSKKSSGAVYFINLFKHSNSQQCYFDYSHISNSVKFRTGGSIELFKYNEPAFSAVICSNNAEEKIVYVKLLKSGLIINDNEEFQIKQKFISVPFQRMIDGLKYLKNHGMDPDILNNLLGEVTVKTNHDGIQYLRNTQDSELTLPNFLPLNESQINALKKALTSNISIIQGPPGTGKTQTSASIVWNIVKILSQHNQKNSKILVSSSSNTAVDNLVERIHRTGVKVIKVASRLREKIKNNSEIVEQNSLHTLLNQFIRSYHPGMVDLFSCVFEYDEVVEPEALDKLMKVVEPAIEKILNEVDVVCCTNIVAGDKRLIDFEFSYVLIDEANLSTETESLLPLLHGCKNLILLGDQMQLGPVTLCNETKKAGLCTSLITRLIKCGLQPTVLNTQYRMHPCISEFPNKFFYNNQIVDGVNYLNRAVPINFWPNSIPTIFLHNKFNEASSGNNSVSNINEAYSVIKVICKMMENHINVNKIVVITPYEAQKDVILDIARLKHIKVSVLNIDEFQGSEQDYVIFSTVRSNSNFNIGFLNDFRRMNVAVTRARLGLVILGDCLTLLESKLWRHFIKFYHDKELIFEGSFERLEPWACEIGEFENYDFSDTFEYFA